MFCRLNDRCPLLATFLRRNPNISYFNTIGHLTLKVLFQQLKSQSCKKGRKLRNKEVILRLIKLKSNKIFLDLISHVFLRLF